MPRDMQHILSKSYTVEKIADVQNKEGDVRHSAITQEMKQETEKRASSVNESEQSEGKTLDSRQERRRRQEEQRRQERKKRIAEKLKRDSGHIIDLEA